MCGYMSADTSVPWYVCRGHKEASAVAPLLIQSLLLMILLCVPGLLVWEHPEILLNLSRLTLAVPGLQMILYEFEDSYLGPLPFPASTFIHRAVSSAQFIF